MTRERAMPNLRAVLAFASLFALFPAVAHAQPQPVTVFEPTMPPLDGDGTGLCARSDISGSPLNDFGFLNVGTFNDGINAFLEVSRDTRVEAVVRTLLDLSNNNDTGLRLSYGDFVSSMAPACRVGGCDFAWNDTSTSFASRLRGFLNVTQDWVGEPIHFGFYADDAVSLTFFDKTTGPKPVLTRPTQLGIPTWRTTNSVTFQQPGIYPLEILYVEVAEHAALEMSYLRGDFTDFELAANEPGSTRLNEAGFTIFEPTRFFQTLSGAPSFSDLDQCQQCNRQFINQSGNSGCPSAYYCNEAALCAPCDTAQFCGPLCSRCDGDTPFCIDRNGQRECGECRDDYDCRNGFTCDPATNTCHECNVDPDCPRGEICVEHSCTPCETSERCAGNSCNCCPLGSNGKQMECAQIEPDGSAVCVECTSDADCTDGQICHRPTGYCVEERPKNDKPDCCGEGCVDCMNPEDPASAPPVPFCLPGPVGTACAACRNDMDCAEGQYCLSGECKECIKDRRCGLRCDSCFGDTPFCLGQFADSATCVRCTSDAQCVGGQCNPETHECEPTCLATCAPETPYCDGQSCVECYADTQCPCGNTCDLATNTCDTSCKTNADCLGIEHCRWKEEGDAKECALGPMPDNVACGGTLADICSVTAVGRRGAAPPLAGLFGLAVLALLNRRRGGARS